MSTLLSGPRGALFQVSKHLLPSRARCFFQKPGIQSHKAVFQAVLSRCGPFAFKSLVVVPLNSSLV